MSSFFVSADKIKVGQTSVSVPSENGLDYRPNGKIDIYVPPTSKFIDLSQSKLKMNVSLAIPTISATSKAQRLQLDSEIGLHSLIRSIRIFSGRKTALLEEIEGYDVLTALRFDYETNKSVHNKRVLTEGSVGVDEACRSTLGATYTKGGNCLSNPYFDTVEGNTTRTASFTADATNDFKVAKGELHLNTGLFRNSAVFPTILTDGLFIEIVLQEPKRVFRQLDSTTKDRRLALNPVFHSVNGSNNGSTTIAKDAATTVTFLTRDNNQTSIPVCPFVVGQEIGWVSGDGDQVNASFATITEIAYETGGAGTAFGTSKIKLTHTSASNTMTGVIWGENVATSASKCLVCNHTAEGAAAYDPTYTISDVELVVEQIEVPQGYEQSMMGMMREGGTINYDYRSFTNYRYSQPTSDMVANIRLPLIESKATSILCVPTDASNYTAREILSCSATYLENNDSADVENRSCRSGLVGICDELQDYQLIYDGKINPSRPVDTSKIALRNSISQQWVIEAEKALAMADIEPLSFEAFQSNFFIGRALALGKNAVYDARGKDFNLQVNYTLTQPSKNHLWMNFVSHIRTLRIKNNSLEVLV
jgi:hypothetical protein